MQNIVYDKNYFDKPLTSGLTEVNVKIKFNNEYGSLFMLEPRTYQLEAIEAVNEFRSQGITRQLISLPTGTGKTVIFALLAKAINTKTLIVAHTEELINQAKEKLEMVWPGGHWNCQSRK